MAKRYELAKRAAVTPHQVLATIEYLQRSGIPATAAAVAARIGTVDVKGVDAIIATQIRAGLVKEVH